MVWPSCKSIGMDTRGISCIPFISTGLLGFAGLRPAASSAEDMKKVEGNCCGLLMEPSSLCTCCSLGPARASGYPCQQHPVVQRAGRSPGLGWLRTRRALSCALSLSLSLLVNTKLLLQTWLCHLAQPAPSPWLPRPASALTKPLASCPSPLESLLLRVRSSFPVCFTRLASQDAEKGGERAQRKGIKEIGKQH